MHVPLLQLLPALRLSTPPGQDLDHAQIAIEACIVAVQTYFPCQSVTPTNHTCLCEQYTWRARCYENHATSLFTQPGYVPTLHSLRDNCYAAGDTDFALVQHKYHLERRQINSFLNSVGGIAASFLSKQSVIVIPSAIQSIRLPSFAPPATPTPQETAATPSAQNSGQTPAPARTTFSTSPSSATASDTAQTNPESTSTSIPASNPSKSSSPPTGIIVGAVVGGIAILLLLGILTMLILRHKRKKREAAQPAYQCTVGTASARSLDETLVGRTPMVEHSGPTGGPGLGEAMVPGHGYGHEYGHGPEKETWRRSQQQFVPGPHPSDVRSGGEGEQMPRQNELYTSANVWELDGSETRSRTELESPAVSRVASPLVSPIVEDKRDGARGFDFGFDERRAPGRGPELHF